MFLFESVDQRIIFFRECFETGFVIGMRYYQAGDVSKPIISNLTKNHKQQHYLPQSVRLN